jgi:hypothetical protein
MRRLDMRAVKVVDVAANLVASGVGAADAFVLAAGLVDGSTDAKAITSFVSLRYDRELHHADIGARLSLAAERVISKPRGRPPRRAPAPH